VAGLARRRGGGRVLSKCAEEVVHLRNMKREGFLSLGLSSGSLSAPILAEAGVFREIPFQGFQKLGSILEVRGTIWNLAETKMDSQSFLKLSGLLCDTHGANFPGVHTIYDVKSFYLYEHARECIQHFQ